MKPYISLGFLSPKDKLMWPGWNARKIGLQLTALTQRLGLIPHDDPAHGPLKLAGKNWYSTALHAEVRRRTFKTAQAEGWHYDADLEPNGNPNCAIVLWASNSPTEIKWKPCSSGVDEVGKNSDRIYKPEPYEVIVFHNLHCLHRRPANAPRIRWVYRQRCSIPTRLDLP